MRWYAECRQELLHVVVGVFAQHPLLRRLRISAPDCFREVVQVGASLPNEFKACGLSVTGIYRRHTVFTELFEFVQTSEPA